MSVVAVTSSRTSPGATTLAAGLAIVWSHLADRSLLVEADPAGGVLALRFDLAPAPSLTSFGSDIRNGFEQEALWRNTQDLRGVACMPAPVDPVLARSWVDRVTPVLIEELPRLGAPVVIDLGWVDQDGVSAKLANAADTVLIVTRPDVAEIQALLFQVRRLQTLNTNVAIVCIGDGPNDPTEIARIAGVPLAAVLPDDPRVAAALSGAKFKPGKFKRSMLWRTISGLGTSLLDDALLEQRMVDSQPSAAVPLPTAASIPPPPSPASVAAALGSQPLPAAPEPEGLAPTPQPAPRPPTVISFHRPALASPRHGHLDSDVLADTTRLQQPEATATLTLPTGETKTLVGAITIGRHSDCDVVLNDNQDSRRHGRLVPTVNGWHYSDLGSRNGTEINGHPCTDAVLGASDVLMIGRTPLTFDTTSQREMECA